MEQRNVIDVWRRYYDQHVEEIERLRNQRIRVEWRIPGDPDTYQWFEFKLDRTSYFCQLPNGHGTIDVSVLPSEPQTEERK